jgi:hypothetical protein
MAQTEAAHATKEEERRSIGRCSILFSQKTRPAQEFAFEAWSRKLQLIIVWLPSRKHQFQFVS